MEGILKLPTDHEVSKRSETKILPSTLPTQNNPEKEGEKTKLKYSERLPTK